jgi:4-hydroxy-tetrahydrodipicolinate synthase
MTSHPLAGVFAAALTPLRANFSLDIDSVPVLLDFLAQRGCHGALLTGTTGEGPSFSQQERVDIFRAAVGVRASRRDFKLLAGTGTPSLTETIELNRAAFDLGFDGVVVLPPYYFRKATDDGLYEWFSQVISRSVPENGYLLGYHIPNTAGIGFSIPLLSKLKDNFPVQFAGIKDSSHDADFAHNLGDLFGDELLVLTGTDTYLQLALENLAGGCITAPANLISPYLRTIWDAFIAGKDSIRSQAKVTELRHILEKYAPFPPVIKALAARLHNFPHWAIRPPLLALSADMEERALEEFIAVENKK